MIPWKEERQIAWISVGCHKIFPRIYLSHIEVISLISMMRKLQLRNLKHVLLLTHNYVMGIQDSALSVSEIYTWLACVNACKHSHLSLCDIYYTKHLLDYLSFLIPTGGLWADFKINILNYFIIIMRTIITIYVVNSQCWGSSGGFQGC